VVAFASALPSSLKMKALNEKYLLKRLARSLVPTAVSQRSKQPYRAPEGKAFFGPRPPEYVGDLLSSAQVNATASSNRTRSRDSCGNSAMARPSASRTTWRSSVSLSTQILVDRFVNHFWADFMEPLIQELRAFIVDNFLFGDASAPFAFADEDSFQERGIVDSTGILELVCHLQETYAIEIKDEELLVENLDSLSRVARFIERKRQGRPAVIGGR